MINALDEEISSLFFEVFSLHRSSNHRRVMERYKKIFPRESREHLKGDLKKNRKASVTLANIMSFIRFDC